MVMRAPRTLRTGSRIEQFNVVTLYLATTVVTTCGLLNSTPQSGKSEGLVCRLVCVCVCVCVFVCVCTDMPSDPHLEGQTLILQPSFSCSNFVLAIMEGPSFQYFLFPILCIKGRG